MAQAGRSAQIVYRNRKSLISDNGPSILCALPNWSRKLKIDESQ
jgi:hypothetical protein